MNIDASILKVVPLNERCRVQFRGEFFNVVISKNSIFVTSLTVSK
jgi:hypothetical protein